MTITSPGSESTITVKPMTGTIGAEIFGVDLQSDFGDDILAQIKDAFAQYQVVFFRDQEFDYDSLAVLGRRFGELVTHSGVSSVEGHPYIVAIHADADSKYVAGDGWHSDVSADAAPPMGSILYLHTVPEVGGDTSWVSMYQAYDSLSEPMKQYLEGKKAVHDANPVYKRLFPDLDKTYPRTEHPMVRTHPVTGRKALFVNPSYTTEIVGVDRLESKHILNYLFEHCTTDPGSQVRFRWEPGSVAFWDNRCTLHRAVWDYYPAVRSGFRVTIAGEVPV